MRIIRAIISLFFPFFTRAETEWVRNQISDFSKMLSQIGDHYITFEETDELIARWRPLYVKIKCTWIWRKHPIYQICKQFQCDFECIKDTISHLNNLYLEAESIRCDALLSDINGKNLDKQQRTVVLTDESRTLALAGAGSGKSLTILGKIKYLCEVKGVASSDILVLSFTRASANEMQQKLNQMKLKVTAQTFHKLGLNIIKQASNTPLLIETDTNKFVRQYFEKNIVNSPDVVKNLIEFFAYYLQLPAGVKDWESLEQAFAEESEQEFETLRSQCHTSVKGVAAKRRMKSITLKGEKVKSMEEVSIANFFFLHGVNYEYEKPYPYDVGDPMKSKYRPDFYLPDYDIWLEHFGITRQDRCPWLDEDAEAEYRKGIAWKRQVHEMKGTKLLETYSYLSSEGILLEHLDTLLQKNGVQYNEPDIGQIYRVLYGDKTARYFTDLVNLCSTFLALFKSDGYGISDLEKIVEKNKALRSPYMRKRTALFAEIMVPLMCEYEHHLRETGAIDFSDMINDASDLVANGLSVHKYKYIIIDEYQDISFARYSLIKAILAQTGAKLLCVGDDWQSIYRFSGSDLNLFTEFEKYYGRCLILRLEHTYRNAQQLIDIAGKFITKNPKQYRKNLSSPISLDYPISFLRYETNPAYALYFAVEKIRKDFGSEKTIYFLGRFNSDKDKLLASGLFVEQNQKLIYKPAPETGVTFLTVHKSKGLEADNVILLNFQDSIHGFPCQITDDPLLSLVLTEQEPYPFAEERRLLYVALTRTKNRIFVLTDKEKPSVFFKEFTNVPGVWIYPQLDQNNKTE